MQPTSPNHVDDQSAPHKRDPHRAAPSGDFDDHDRADAADNGPTDDDGDGLDHIRDPDARRHPLDRFTPAQIVTALENAGGIYLGAAKQLKCSPTTIANYIRRHPDIRRAKERIEHEKLDMAEALLFRRMKDESQPFVQLRAIIFYLSTRGASRGYGLRAAVKVNVRPSNTPKNKATDVKVDFSHLPEAKRRWLDEAMAEARARGAAKKRGDVDQGHRD